MKTNERAVVSELKELLARENLTLVLFNGEEYYTSRERGISPLLNFAESGKSFRGFAAADKIVGKAAAFLYAGMGISALYAEVITREAVKICERNNIAVEYGVLTDNIVNRAGNGICPMEEAVRRASEPENAKSAVRNKLRELRNEQRFKRC